MKNNFYSYLALGDSYTIGEQVSIFNSFSYQTTQIMRKKGFAFSAPEIIAQTGFTTSELIEQLSHTTLIKSYDFVTLLIGVNNQYRSLSADDYKNDFEIILKQAIDLANGDANKVIVLSIPDWSVTPFAIKSEREKIAEEIDIFNKINLRLTESYKSYYIDITSDTRLIKEDESLLTIDGLHYSKKQYNMWAEKIAAVMCITL